MFSLIGHMIQSDAVAKRMFDDRALLWMEHIHLSVCLAAELTSFVYGGLSAFHDC